MEWCCEVCGREVRPRRAREAFWRWEQRWERRTRDMLLGGSWKGMEVGLGERLGGGSLVWRWGFGGWDVGASKAWGWDIGVSGLGGGVRDVCTIVVDSRVLCAAIVGAEMEVEVRRAVGFREWR